MAFVELYYSDVLCFGKWEFKSSIFDSSFLRLRGGISGGKWREGAKKTPPLFLGQFQFFSLP